MNQPALVQAQAISKKFCRDLKESLCYGIADIGREFIGRTQTADRLRRHEFWVLRDVSFQLRRGEALGLLGRNGAGKTTLLRMLNGLIRPDLGSIRIGGTVAPLIELGSGFAPVLTGRENIYINGAILGLPKRAVAALLDRIVDFAELGEFIDMPVQGYSEGMKARLGFAVAAHLSPDLMLVDEVLAVGDVGFQRKCIHHMEAYLNNGGALIFVSHNMHLVQSICQSCLVLEKGRIAFEGVTAGAVERYSKLNEATSTESENRLQAAPDESNPVVIDRIDMEAKEACEIRPGGALLIRLHYRSFNQSGPVTWGFSLWTADSAIRISTSVAKYQGKVHRLCKGAGQLSCVIQKLPLVPGSYLIKAGIYDIHTGWPIARFGWDNVGRQFEITGSQSETDSRHRIDNDILNLDVDWMS